MAYIKNTAGQHIGFAGVKTSDGSDQTGTTGFAAYVVIDGGAQAAATGTVTDKGHGQYDFALSQADVNGDVVSIKFGMTGMVSVEKTIVTEAAPLVTSGTGANQISVSGGKVLLQATQTGVTIPNVTTVGATTDLTNLPAVPTDWLTAAGVKADAVTKIQTGLATPTNITGGTVGSVTNPVTIDLTPVVPTNGAANSIADCLNGARVVAFGADSITDNAWTLKNHDGSTAITFTITTDSAGKVTARTTS